MAKRKLKPIPEFESEAEEQEFWATHDTTEYFDWSQARSVTLPKLEPSTTPISLRLPETLLADLKRLANEQDVPYQSLMTVYLAERAAVERIVAVARLDRAHPLPSSPGRTELRSVTLVQEWPVVVVNMHEAKTQLSKLVDQAVKGEPFVIAKAGKPLVRVVAVDAPAAPQRLGFLAGEVTVPDDFDRMGAEEIAALFGTGT